MLASVARRWRGRERKTRWELATAAALAFAAVAIAAEPPWPPFLDSPDRFPFEVAERVERVWRDPTLTRTVHGRAAAVPFDRYVVFVDTPDVTTAAGRFLGLTRDEVRPLDDDLYEADDHDGARGRYRVLARGPSRRVVLSWGGHRGSILGMIHGDALTVLDFETRDGRIEQTLTAYVRIDNAFAARLARILVSVFGGLADRKLGEGFAVSAKVAEWAVERPEEFCEWLAGAPVGENRRQRVREALGCR